jgi:hypothetical protein
MHLDDEVLIHVCRDGTVTFRTRDEPNFNGASLPVYSVPDKATAEKLRVLLCRSQYVEHPLLPGQTWYRLDHAGTVEGLTDVTERFRQAHDKLRGKA